MNITLGIVGLPNSGKSTLFNVLVGEKSSLTAVTPFTTIVHKEGKVLSSDNEINFIDIAGLVGGSHQGRGVGNMFLEKIRKCDAILHVVRAFYNPIVEHLHRKHEPGSLIQIYEDIDVVREELRVAGVHKKVLYVLNFDESKYLSGVVDGFIAQIEHKYNSPAVGVCAKLEEGAIGLVGDDLKNFVAEKKIGEQSINKIIVKVNALLSFQNDLN